MRKIVMGLLAVVFGSFLANSATVYAADNVCVGGTATASSETPGYEAGYAFDGSTSTIWGNAGVMPSWIQYDFGAGNEKIIGTYKMNFTSNTTPYMGGYGVSPNTWSFQGSNDGVNWTTFHDQSEVSGLWYSYVVLMDYANGWGTFSFVNTTAYRFYRVYVTASNNTTTNRVAINEIQMFEGFSIPGPGGSSCIDITASIEQTTCTENGSYTLSATCPSGTFLLTGGCNSQEIGWAMHSSYPNKGAFSNSWVCSSGPVSPYYFCPASLSAYARCCK